MLLNNSLNKDCKNYFESFILACFLNIPFINFILCSLFTNSSVSIMSILYGLFTSLLLICFIFKYKTTLFYASKIPMIILFTIVAMYFYSILLNSSSISMINLLIYVMVPFFVISKMKLDGKQILFFIIVISSCGIPFVNTIFIPSNSTISMGLSYALLLPIISSIGYILLYKKHNFFVLILALINLIYLFLLLIYGSRGPILSIILAFLFFILLRKKILYKNDDFLFLKFFLIIILIIFLYLLRWPILLSIDNFLAKFNIEFEFIDKMIKLENSIGVDNGRIEILYAFLENFVTKPLLGHGIQSFEIYTGFIYPHNFIFQMFFDIGVIGALIILIPFLVNLVKLLKKLNYYENTIILLVLFFSAIPGALFSMDLWLNPLLWVFLMLVIRIDYRV